MPSFAASAFILALATNLFDDGVEPRPAAAPSPTGASPAAPSPTPTEDAGAAAQASLGQMRAFVLDKLRYDAEYFGKVVSTHDQGRTLGGLAGGAWQREVARARLSLPVLQRFLRELPSYDAGHPLTLPADKSLHREYRNLLALLDMFQAHVAARPRDVVRFGDSIDVRAPDDFGRVRGAGVDYYVSMYRAYFYLMGSAHFALRDDARAVEWFARLQADTSLAALQARIEKEDTVVVDPVTMLREKLRTRPVAVMPLANLTGDRARDFVGPSVAEVLTGDLGQASDLLVVERTQIERLGDEVALSLSGATQPGAATQAGNLLNAGTLLLGSLAQQGDALRLSLRLVAVEGEVVLGAQSRPTTEDTLFADARACLLDVLGQAGWDAGLVAEDLLARHAPRPANAARLFEARLLRASKSEEARALYAAAVKEDPALANLYSDLRAQFRDVSATVAVLPFVNASGRAEDAWMGVGVVDALATDLPRLGFTTLERQRIDDVLLARGDGGAIVEGALAASAGQLLNADYTVIGSVLHQAPAIRIDLRVIEVRSGIIAYTSSAENRRDDLPAAIVALTAQLANRFNAPLSSDDLDELVAAKMTPADFEKAFRAEFAKKNLRDSARRDGGPPDVATVPAAALPWGAVAGGAGVAVGLTTAIAGFVLADPFVATMYRAEGQIDVLPPDVDVSGIAAEGRSAQEDANVRLIAAWTGVAIAAVSAVWLVVDGVLPDESAAASHPGSR